MGENSDNGPRRGSDDNPLNQYLAAIEPLRTGDRSDLASSGTALDQLLQHAAMILEEHAPVVLAHAVLLDDEIARRNPQAIRASVLRIAQALKLPGSPPELRAQALDALALDLSWLGRHAEALAPAEQAVDIYRRLAEDNPAAYLPNLAGSLTNLGASLWELGRRGDALAPTEGGVRFWRRLADENPAAHLPDLAMSLTNLGSLLSELGRRGDALAPTAQAVDIRRQLANENPAAHLPNLAIALTNLGTRLSELGRHSEALAPTQEAVDIYWQLANENPAAYLPNLAIALNNLGNRRWERGRRGDALAPTEEAVGINRQLAEDYPAAHLPNLAMSLTNLGARLSALGRGDEALAPTEEAVDIYRRLAEDHPAAYLPDLAMSVSNLGLLLSALGRSGDALAPTEEGVDFWRRLAEENPAAYLPRLAMSVSNLGALLWTLGRHDDAIAPAQQAVAIGQQLAENNPAAYLPSLAMSLTNLGLTLAALGRHDKALAPAQHAVAIDQQLAENNPAAYLPNLAGSLTNLGRTLAALGHRADAASCFAEVTELGGRSPAIPIGQMAKAIRRLLTLDADSAHEDEGPILAGFNYLQRHGVAQVAALPGAGDRARLLNEISGLLGEGARRIAARAGAEAAVTYVDAMSTIEVRLLRSTNSTQLETLRQRDPRLAHRLEAAWHTRDNTSTAGDEQSAASMPREDPNQILAEIRALGDEFAGFGMPRTFDQIVDSLAGRTAIVVAADDGGCVLTIDPDTRAATSTDIELLTTDAIREAWAAARTGKSGGATRLARLVGENLPERTAGVVLVGAANLLPMSSVWSKVADPPRLVSSIGADPTPMNNDGGWAVGFSEGPFDPKDPTKRRQPIPGVKDEAARIASITGCEPAEMTDAATARRMLLDACRVHLACHGTSGQSIADAAVLCGDESLTLAGLIDGRSAHIAEFVCLSACESGAPSLGNVEQSASFPSLLSALGTRTAVATLWPVGDRDAVEFVTMMYRKWAGGASLGDAIASTHQAQPLNATFAAYALYGDRGLAWTADTSVELTERIDMTTPESDRRPLDPGALVTLLDEIDQHLLDDDQLDTLTRHVEAWGAAVSTSADPGSEPAAIALAASLTALGAGRAVEDARGERATGLPSTSAPGATNDRTAQPATAPQSPQALDASIAAVLKKWRKDKITQP